MGVLHAAPLRWISTVEGLSREHRSRLARKVVEMDALSMSPLVRGQRLGHRLIEHASAHYRGLGYRVMLGTFATGTLHLVPDYQQAGFTVRGPGESIAVLDPMGMALHRPADPHVIQMWKPLHQGIGMMHTTMPDGSQVEVITGALEPPGRVPEKVVHHDDGSVTLSGGGETHREALTLPAQHVEKLTQMFRTEVTVDEVKAIAAEAERYGMEPLFAAKADVGAQARRGAFTCGHTCSFQTSTASSSLSTAQRTGTWHVQPCPRRSFHTPCTVYPTWNIRPVKSLIRFSVHRWSSSRPSCDQAEEQ